MISTYKAILCTLGSFGQTKEFTRLNDGINTFSRFNIEFEQDSGFCFVSSLTPSVHIGISSNDNMVTSKPIEVGRMYQIRSMDFISSQDKVYRVIISRPESLVLISRSMLIDTCLVSESVLDPTTNPPEDLYMSLNTQVGELHTQSINDQQTLLDDQDELPDINLESDTEEGLPQSLTQLPNSQPASSEGKEQLENSETQPPSSVDLSHSLNSTPYKRKRSSHCVSSPSSKAYKPSNSRNIKVLFSGINPEFEKQLVKILKRFGLKVASSVNTCSVLVQDSLVRSPKLLSAISHGKQVVSDKWLLQSESRNILLDPNDFPLNDSEAESRYSFSLAESLKIAQDRLSPFLEGVKIFVSPGNKPGRKIMRDIIQGAGGIMITSQSAIDSSVVVVADPNETAFSALLKRSSFVYSSETVISAILTQDLNLLRK